MNARVAVQNPDLLFCCDAQKKKSSAQDNHRDITTTPEERRKHANALKWTNLSVKLSNLFAPTSHRFAFSKRRHAHKRTENQNYAWHLNKEVRGGKKKNKTLKVMRKGGADILGIK